MQKRRRLDWQEELRRVERGAATLPENSQGSSLANSTLYDTLIGARLPTAPINSEAHVVNLQIFSGLVRKQSFVR